MCQKYILGFSAINSFPQNLLWFHCMSVESEPTYYLVLTLIESLYGLFFAAFTISMFVESIGLVTSGTTGKRIESDSLNSN